MAIWLLNYTKRVRQGCLLNPILVNIHVNDIFVIMKKNNSSEITLGENKIYALMYSDDLMLLSGRKERDCKIKLIDFLLSVRKYKTQDNTTPNFCLLPDKFILDGNNLPEPKRYELNQIWTEYFNRYWSPEIMLPFCYHFVAIFGNTLPFLVNSMLQWTKMKLG